MTPLIRMGAGLAFTIVALVVALLLQIAINYSDPNSVSVFWMVPQFFFISLAEILLSITCLEFAYTEAPPRMKGMLSATWYLTLAGGNLLVAVMGLLSANTVRCAECPLVHACVRACMRAFVRVCSSHARLAATGEPGDLHLRHADGAGHLYRHCVQVPPLQTRSLPRVPADPVTTLPQPRHQLWSGTDG